MVGFVIDMTFGINVVSIFFSLSWLIILIKTFFRESEFEIVPVTPLTETEWMCPVNR